MGSLVRSFPPSFCLHFSVSSPVQPSLARPPRSRGSRRWRSGRKSVCAGAGCLTAEREEYVVRRPAIDDRDGFQARADHLARRFRRSASSGFAPAAARRRAARRPCEGEATPAERPAAAGRLPAPWRWQCTLRGFRQSSPSGRYSRGNSTNGGWRTSRPARSLRALPSTAHCRSSGPLKTGRGPGRCRRGCARPATRPAATSARCSGAGPQCRVPRRGRHSGRDNRRRPSRGTSKATGTHRRDAGSRPRRR